LFNFGEIAVAPPPAGAAGFQVAGLKKSGTMKTIRTAQPDYQISKIYNISKSENETLRQI